MDSFEKHGERRETNRVTLLIRAAKLITPDGEFLCILKDISEKGISVRLFHDLSITESVFVELQNGDRYGVHPIWRHKDTIAFQFKERCDLARAISGSGDYPPRSVRLNFSAATLIHARNMTVRAIIQNMSHQGARLSCASHQFCIDEPISLLTSHLGAVRAKVRWRRLDSFGVAFIDTFNLSDFARYAAEIQLPMLDSDGAVGPQFR